MILKINNLSFKYQDQKILDNISVEVHPGKTVAILGPSGVGKTSLLRCIAGLERHEGEILFDDKCINDVKPEKRNIGMVSQDLALFPHLTVYENIAFPLKIRKINKKIIDQKVSGLLNQFNLTHLKNRWPQNISGGEQQRVAIARAIIYNPKILLLDEPFAQLDIILRNDLIKWLKQVLNEQKITTLFVTHNVEEAKQISSKIIFLDQNKIVKISENTALML